jgi:hypothetical protein
MSNAAGRKATKMPSREMTVKAEEARVAAKTARLRALRLAKEAVDRNAALHAAPPPAGIPGWTQFGSAKNRRTTR